MVLRVDVVAAALAAAYGGEPSGPVIALTPKGRQLTQPVVAELSALPAFTLLSSRYEGFAEGSGELESFSAELGGGLEYPHYTRPAEFRGWPVPDVLLSGDHARVDAWRRDHVVGI